MIIIFEKELKSYGIVQRKNDLQAVNYASTHVAKTLNFFFNHEKLLNPLKKWRDDVASSHTNQKEEIAKGNWRAVNAHATPVVIRQLRKMRFRKM
jgi:hypothetical protein